MSYDFSQNLLNVRKSIIFWLNGGVIIDNEGTYLDEFNPSIFLFPSRHQANKKSEFDENKATQLSNQYQEGINSLLEFIH